MLIIGLTGNIGSGKSTVAGILRENGVPVIDADQVGHDALLPGGAAYEQVIAAFGEDFLDKDGKLDRKMLGQYIFSDVTGYLRQKISDITHPAILAYIKDWFKEQEAAGAKVVAVESAILFRSDLCDSVDSIWLVRAPREEMLKRAAQRDGVSETSISMRLNAQVPQEQLADYAQLIIDNDKTVDELKEAVNMAWGSLLKELA